MASQQVVSIPQFRGYNNVGKVFFVSATSGVNWDALNLSFSNISAVFTTAALALAQTTAGNGDIVVLASDYTTALTSADVTLAETNGVIVIQAGKNVGNVWFANRATANTPQTTNAVLFTVTGKVKIKALIGTVTKIIQDQAQNFTLYVRDATDATLGSTALAAVTSIRNLRTNGLISLTGTLANSLVTSGLVAVYQAAPLLLNDNTQIKLLTSASSTGQIKWRVDYEPITPGARVFPA